MSEKCDHRIYFLEVGNKTQFSAFDQQTTRRPMTNLKNTNGTLFMALEEGAPWPQFMRQLRSTAANVQAVVQAPGEPAEQFATRVLERWNALVGTSAAPHRFVLGTNEAWDSTSASARHRLACAAMDARDNIGTNRLILWGGNIQKAEDQARLLALAGALVEGKKKAPRHVRVLFGEPSFIGPRSVTRQPASSDLRVA